MNNGNNNKKINDSFEIVVIKVICFEKNGKI